ncbi:MAG: UbiD family decarboxylase [Dehalococcoidia bacterium]|nr:UbiD family decarboxylase [Dehalococcoidia bacterium]
MTKQTAVKKDITSLRSTLEYLSEQEGELLVTETEVDPDLEMAGIQKALDGGPAILFEKVKGYPDKRLFTNLFASEERLAHLFEVEDPRKFKFKCIEALRHPLAPRVVQEAPCQEVVVDKDLDIWSVVPMIAHTATDPGRTLGGGNTLVTGKYFWGGSHVSFNRMNFRGKDFASFQISPGSHTDMIATEWYKKGPIPMTINMGVPPAVTLLAGSGFMYMVVPRGADELGVAGAIQGSPIDIVKARTVDAYSIANAEIVIEGYLDTTQHVWESEEAEREQKQGVFPFHPEWSGYLGRAYRTYKFQATGVTYRRDRAIYYPLIVHGYDDHHIDVKVREAAFLELADRICPGLVVDTNIPLGMTDWGGVIFQVKKRRARDEGFQKNILATAIAASQGLRIAIAVDEDVDIYNAEDIMWALTTRVDAQKGIEIVCPGGMGQTFQPAERAAAAPGAQWVRSESKYAGGIALDATVPFQYKWAFERARYPVERVDLRRWFPEKDIAKAYSKLGEYARYLARTGI